MNNFSNYLIVHLPGLYGKNIKKNFIYDLINIIPNMLKEDKFQEFLNLIINRSIYNFNTPVSSSDKILTLSTCSNNGKNRLVIHAVLLAD